MTDTATPTRQTAEQRLAHLRNEVKRARIWAGDRLNAQQGTTLIHMLERALKESR